MPVLTALAICQILKQLPNEFKIFHRYTIVGSITKVN